MAYEVLARKWRPQQFDDVVGQEHVTRTLKNAITNNRLAHAYLLVGPRGIGKTSIARIFAKSLNCKDGATLSPCGKCDSCKEITGGNSLDVIEIDGASNNGVEQVRDLRETVKYAPTRGKFKIYIIDEVHMLSHGAFNALLKTLEEPPSHVKFFFATTEAEKIPATIISRCQRFDLRRIPVPEIVERLELIAKAEGVEIDQDALLAIARGSEGGLRDAESALDQLISFRGNKINEDDVLSVFGLVARKTLEDLAGSILKGDIKAIIKTIAKLDQSGKDLQRLVLELIEHFRNLLVAMNVQDAAEGLDLTEAQVSVLREQAKSTNTGRVLRLADILSEVESRMRYTLSKKTLLETALIRCAQAAVVITLEEILEEIRGMRGQAASGTGEPPAAKKPVQRAAPQEKEQATPEGEDGEEEASLGSTNVVKEQKLGIEVAPAADEVKLLTERWREVVDKAGKIYVSARSVLNDVRPVKVEKTRVVLAFDPEFADESERFQNMRARKAVEHVLSGILKRDVTIDISQSAQPEQAPREEQQDAPEIPQQPVKKEKTKTKQEILNDPAVQKALDVFGGGIVDVR